jgi:endonuclease I
VYDNPGFSVYVGNADNATNEENCEDCEDWKRQSEEEEEDEEGEIVRMMMKNLGKVKRKVGFRDQIARE